MKNKEDYVKDFTETRSVCKYRRNIRVVYVGGTGNHGRLMIDAPKEVKIARSTVEQNPERRKDTYYPEPAISKEAQDEIKKILWNERMKAETKKDAERMSH